MYRISLSIALLVALTANTVQALPTIGKTPKKNVLKTAAGCNPATATIDLDINNVRGRLMTGGDMWWDQGAGVASYEIPKGSRKNALFAGSCWVGGFQDGALKVAAQLFRNDGNDYWPGPLNTNNGTYEIDQATCNQWDRFWKIDRTLVNEFKQLSDREAAKDDDRFRAIFEWPARGNGSRAAGNTGGLNANTRKARGSNGQTLAMDDRDYAPFVDVDGNGIYNPEGLDYPNMENPGRGDQMIWWVFNDRGNNKLQTKSESIGLEIQTSAFAFSSKDFLNDATFYNYRVINRAGLTLDSAYMATWTDADLGFAFDDFIGCDTARGLGILYNANPIDGNGEPTSYGANPPMVGVDFFIGPQRYTMNPLTGVEDTVKLKMSVFSYFINGGGGNQEISDPTTATEFYFYMTGSRRFGARFSYDPASRPCTGLNEGDPVSFVFAGEMNSGWSECVCSNAPGDRRFIHSAGPFQLRPGDVNDIIIGAVWVANAGGCPSGSFSKIKVADDLTQELFDNNFRTIEGPEAPRVLYREMDRKVIFYMQNDPNSTNFQEKFGYDIDSIKYRVVSRKAANAKFADSLYKFEGYRLFQLKNALITPAQIFDENGELDQTVAREVFQCDVKNGVSKVIGWTKDTRLDGCDNCWIPVVKVEGKDSGIVHSFQIANDAFATGDDQRLVNYKSYYYLAIAYAYNNFASFNQFKFDSTQDKPYLESAKGPAGVPLSQMIMTVMPNPANGDMGTVFNSDYGSGVVITQLEGKGNGGNDLQMSRISEEEALSQANEYQVKQPVYDSGRGPISVKVVDPAKVVAANWKLYMLKDETKAGDFATSLTDVVDPGIIIPQNAKWALVKDGDMNSVMYSERNIDAINEQIVEQYGLSINIKQVVRPGDDQTPAGRNGLISSSVVYSDANMPWLRGVNDQEQENFQNWIRSGQFTQPEEPIVPDCDFADNPNLDSLQFYESLLSNTVATLGTWAPYELAAGEDMSACGFGVREDRPYSGAPSAMYKLQSVDIVFTSDKSKWSKCLVLEMTDDDNDIFGPLAEGGARKLTVRRHASWNLGIDGNGNPQYATDPADTSFSYFPGYVINQETGERLNIMFGESSFLKNQNGQDMIWNPTSALYDAVGNPIWGGRHYIYVSNSKYDGCASIMVDFNNISPIVKQRPFTRIMWVGLPLANDNMPLLSLRDGLIPTETRVKFRVNRPYAYNPIGIATDNTFNAPGYPKYQFTTADLAPMRLSDGSNPYSADKKKLLDGMHVVPNPYYAYNGYEKNRLDTRVRVVNLPHKATVHIYSLDGSLIKKLTKDDQLPYIDWDIRNAKGLPIAGGMYLIHIKAEGIGEKVVKWFGAMRPVDVNNY